MEEGTLTLASEGGFHPDDRRLLVDYIEWLKANGLPTGWVDHADLQPEEEPDVLEEVILPDGTSEDVLRGLAPSVASALMKILFAARMAQFDLLPVQRLATFMTK